MFQVVKPIIGYKVDFENVTSHMNSERRGELDKVTGTPRYSFLVDTGHKNGLEVHTITTDAEVIIVNERTGSLITVLFARPQQIKRYFKTYPKSIVDKAHENVARKDNKDRI